MKKLALFGGEPIRKKPFPSWPCLGKEEINAVVEVLKKGHLSTFAAPPSDLFLGGEKIRKFENNFAKYHNTDYAVALNSATAGLHAALAAVETGPGNEVIVTPYSFTSSASSILMNNATPVFADVNIETFNIKPEEIKKVITPRTKAIVVVHLLGNPAEMDEIMKIAKKNNLAIIEDCAQAIGAKYKNKLVGTMGDIGVFSFNEPKNISTGEGGMIITNNKKLAEKCRLIRNHGEALDYGKKERSYSSTILGWNYRMTELEAAIGTEQLRKMDKFNEIRIRNAHYLKSKLSDIKGLRLPSERKSIKHVYHIYGIFYDSEKTGIPRKEFINALKAEGIPCSGGYPHPLYKNPIFLKKTKCKNAEKLCYESALWIPIIRPPCTIKDMDDVVSAIKKIIENKQEFNLCIKKIK